MVICESNENVFTIVRERETLSRAWNARLGREGVELELGRERRALASSDASERASARDPGSSVNERTTEDVTLAREREVNERRDLGHWGTRKGEASTRARVEAWVEADALRRVAGKYVPFAPPPRSTIAVAYSPDGSTLASTHGDHTVKLTDCESGRRVRALEGHGRTPWVVRFHPTNSDVLASGSLDNTVIVWDRASGGAVARWDFGKSIASLAFYHEGDILCVTAGHKLYAWKYKKYRSPSQTNANGTVIDHSKAVKVLLRTPRSLRAVHFHPTGAPTAMTAEVRDVDPSSMDRAFTRNVDRGVPSSANVHNDQQAGIYVAARDARTRSQIEAPNGERSESVPTLARASSSMMRGDQTPRAAENAITMNVPDAPHRGHLSALHAQLPTGSSSQYANVLLRMPSLSASTTPMQAPTQVPTQAMPRITGPPALVVPAGGVAAAAAAVAQSSGDQDPCIVRLKLWNFKTAIDEDGELEILPFEETKLVLEHTVLCSEMGAHFSPCGRYLATCQACKPPPSLALNGVGETTRYICEVRTYSLDGSNFGEVLNARAVKAAHCLTSIQFSPTSEHVLLAYGRRHPSLYLLMADAESFSQVHTILEIFSAKDMHLVRIIPSVEDEVNAACFHPTPGQGIAYGTKEGKLRVLMHDRSPEKMDKRFDAADSENSPLTTAV